MDEYAKYHFIIVRQTHNSRLSFLEVRVEGVGEVFTSVTEQLLMDDE
jgi:hypothetical protein